MTDQQPEVTLPIYPSQEAIVPAGGIELTFTTDEVQLLYNALSRYASDRSTIIPQFVEERPQFQAKAVALAERLFKTPITTTFVFTWEERQTAMAALNSRIQKYRFAAYRCEAVGDKANTASWQTFYKKLEALRSKIANEMTTGVRYPYEAQPKLASTLPDGSPLDFTPQDPRLDDIHTSYPG